MRNGLEHPHHKRKGRNAHEELLYCLPADGIGPEAIASTLQVLEKLTQFNGGISFDFQNFDWSFIR
jgi:isocitrate/isopropylmalate dehydrogenase